MKTSDFTTEMKKVRRTHFKNSLYSPVIQFLHEGRRRHQQKQKHWKQTNMMIKQTQRINKQIIKNKQTTNNQHQTTSTLKQHYKLQTGAWTGAGFCPTGWGLGKVWGPQEGQVAGRRLWSCESLIKVLTGATPTTQERSCTQIKFIFRCRNRELVTAGWL